jgi:site-specific recombinase XerD
MKKTTLKHDVQLTDSSPLREPPTDFFEDEHSWLTFPSLAFSSWVSHQNLAQSTMKVRKSMWDKFSRWMLTEGIAVHECRGQDVLDFIKSNALEKEQAWRYVRLVEKVYDRLIGLGLDIANPGSKAGKEGVGNQENDEKRFLTPEERQKLDAFLKTVLRDVEGEGGRREFDELKPGPREARWAGIRDVIIAAVIYGAGVKLTEVAKLSVSCTYENGLIVPAEKRGGILLAEHVAPLFSLAADALRIWSYYRDAYENVGKLMFPAMINRRREDRKVKTAAMHPSTIFRRVQNVLRQAGITSVRACGQTLRNTYAARLIDGGASDAALKEALGFQGDFSVAHLRQAHKEWLGKLEEPYPEPVEPEQKRAG